MSALRQHEIIRRLAGELAEVASLPEQEEKREGWRRLNGLRPVRPMLWITEIPWREFERNVDELRPQCEDETLRPIEAELRRRLFTARRLPCDEVIEPIWLLPKVITGDDYGLEVKDIRIAQGDAYVSSHHFEPVIRDFADVEEIRMPEVRYDEAETLARKERLEGLFGDALPVLPCGMRRHWFNAWDQVVRWTGVTEALSDLADRPDFIHAIMRRITDATLARYDQYEALGLLDHLCAVPRVGSGGSGYVDELPRPGRDPARIRTMDQWGGATAQIFGEVSPAMHEEFALKYEIEVMERCGLNYYGCCEPLHNKMKLMAKVPRLRKISISPWCDVAKAAANAAQKYVFSHKPNPACFAADALNLARAEQELRDRLARSGDMPCEIIMKDISTVRGDVTRLIAWCEMAHRTVKESAAR